MNFSVQDAKQSGVFIRKIPCGISIWSHGTGSELQYLLILAFNISMSSFATVNMFTAVRTCRCPLVACFYEFCAAMPWRHYQIEDQVPPSAMPCTWETKNCADRKERGWHILLELHKARLRHDMEPKSPTPDILPFQTSRHHDIKSTSNLTKYDIIFSSSEKDEFSCQPQSLLTNICFLCLAISFQHWPLSIDRFSMRSNHRQWRLISCQSILTLPRIRNKSFSPVKEPGLKRSSNNAN